MTDLSLDAPVGTTPTQTPRLIALSTLFFKSLTGLGIGIIGTIILLIFVFIGLGTTANGVGGPFFSFIALVMGLVTALVTNVSAVYVFSLIDRDKYLPSSATLPFVTGLNIFTFIILLPVYVLAIASSSAGHETQTIFYIAALQLVISAMASALIIELLAVSSQRDKLLSIYGITFGMLGAIVMNLLIFNLVQALTLTTDTDTGAATSSAATAILFSILPATWFFFGFCTTVVEMVYRWVYIVWGTDYLARTSQ